MTPAQHAILENLNHLRMTGGVQAGAYNTRSEKALFKRGWVEVSDITIVELDGKQYDLGGFIQISKAGIAALGNTFIELTQCPVCGGGQDKNGTHYTRNKRIYVGPDGQNCYGPVPPDCYGRKNCTHCEGFPGVIALDSPYDRCLRCLIDNGTAKVIETHPSRPPR